ncbi:MAG: hypothetical protein C0494_15915 [Sphingobium sp.]|nr:hypothetical protein [Sphingobium sp.]
MIGRRLKKLEIQEMGEGRVIVVVWPGADVATALNTKGIEERPGDLVINIDKGPAADFAGWVTIDGVRVG